MVPNAIISAPRSCRHHHFHFARPSHVQLRLDDTLDGLNVPGVRRPTLLHSLGLRGHTQLLEFASDYLYLSNSYLSHKLKKRPIVSCSGNVTALVTHL